NTSLQSSFDLSLATGAGFVYNIVCTGFYIWLVRNVVPCPTNQDFFMCVPYVPSFLSGLVNSLIVATIGTSTYTTTICSTSLFLGDPATDFSYVNGAGYNSTVSGSKWHIFNLSSSTAPVFFD